eukprot:CAMPEP_0118672448 /NCGR_PEP_ID=MMETSP0785-20121206/22544_1 /TAXON_ID=91992 /ORGANISM="Bolidomonas pacifica, Strain CCMP 1866" /LENGTH=84 /DNA_ID=CAMNT_0006567407 /DNA_START=338 /DNA_END=589 /DNA_ORIENTATION=+
MNPLKSHAAQANTAQADAAQAVSSIAHYLNSLNPDSLTLPNTSNAPVQTSIALEWVRVNATTICDFIRDLTQAYEEIDRDDKID